MHAVYDRELKWQTVVETAIDEVDEFDNDKRENVTDIYIVIKSEAWLNGFCIGSCPNNCTANQGGEGHWTYIQKSVSPIVNDLKPKDTKLRIMCKGKTRMMEYDVYIFVEIWTINLNMKRLKIFVIFVRKL